MPAMATEKKMDAIQDKVRRHDPVPNIMRALVARLGREGVRKEKIFTSIDIEDKALLQLLYEMMIIAVRVGYVSLVKHIYSCGFENIRAAVESSSDPLRRRPAFHLACEIGNVNMIKAFVPHKPDLCSSYSGHTNTGRDYKSAFRFAVSHDDVEILELLLPLYRRQRMAEGCAPPLLAACQEGAMRCCRYLVENHPREVNARDSTGYTPLLVAVRHGRPLVELLLEHGAGVAVRTVSKHRSCLHLLYAHQQLPFDWHRVFISIDAPEITEMLITKGADVNYMDTDCQTPLSLLCDNYNTELDEIQIEHLPYPQEKHHEILRRCTDILLNHGAQVSLCGAKTRTISGMLVGTIARALQGTLQRVRWGAPNDNPYTTNEKVMRAMSTTKEALTTMERLLALGAKVEGGQWESPLGQMVETLEFQVNYDWRHWQGIWPSIRHCIRTLLLYGARRISPDRCYKRPLFTDDVHFMILRCLSSRQINAFDEILQFRVAGVQNLDQINFCSRMLIKLQVPRRLTGLCRVTILNCLQRPPTQVAAQLELPNMLISYLENLDED